MGDVQAVVLQRHLHRGPGHVVDGLTGLSYMQARYYDPFAARFLAIDPLAADAGGFNRYWYANNNPYTFIDPDGRCAAMTSKHEDKCRYNAKQGGGGAKKTGKK